MRIEITAHKRDPRGSHGGRGYPEDFKLRVVKLVTNKGLPLAAVTRELKLSETCVRRWIDRAVRDGLVVWTPPVPTTIDVTSRLPCLSRLERL